LGEVECTSFAGRDWLRGREIAEPVAGVADGITADGRLRVIEPGGSLRILDQSAALRLR
jgi:hypothetical protein